MNIDIEKTEEKGSAIARENGQNIGVMTFQIPEQDYIVIDHTEVTEKQQGNDVGKKILMEVVDMARNENLKIESECPFVDTMFERMEEIQDVKR